MTMTRLFAATLAVALSAAPAFAEGQKRPLQRPYGAATTRAKPEQPKTRAATAPRKDVAVRKAPVAIGPKWVCSPRGCR